MKLLLIFLTLPLLLCAEQEEIEYMIDFDPYFYEKNIIIMDGHTFKCIMWEHAQDCPKCVN